MKSKLIPINVSILAFWGPRAYNKQLFLFEISIILLKFLFFLKIKTMFILGYLSKIVFKVSV